MHASSSLRPASVINSLLGGAGAGSGAVGMLWSDHVARLRLGVPCSAAAAAVVKGEDGVTGSGGKRSFLRSSVDISPSEAFIYCAEWKGWLWGGQWILCSPALPATGNWQLYFFPPLPPSFLFLFSFSLNLSISLNLSPSLALCCPLSLSLALALALSRSLFLNLCFLRYSL